MYVYNTTLTNTEYTRKRYNEFHHVHSYDRYHTQFTIPTIYDPRDKLGSYMSPVKNQGTCGSCYAFAISSTLSDRISLLSGNEIHVDLTATNIVICPLPEKGMDLVMSGIMNDPSSIDKFKRIQFEKLQQEKAGCQGNNIIDPCMFVYYVGATLVSCEPETILHNLELPTCEAIEDTVKDFKFNGCYNTDKAQRDFRILHIYRLHTSNKLNIPYEIYKYGPIVSGFIVFPDFYEYIDELKTNPTRIYTHPKRGVNALGGHAISIVGWGEDIQGGRKIDYWLIRNSWGQSFGDKGYFRMERWLPECLLEENVVAFTPDLPNTRNLDLPIPDSVVNTSLLHKRYTEFELRSNYKIDDLTFYSESTIDAIHKGILKGSLQPIYMVNRLPVLDDNFNMSTLYPTIRYKISVLLLLFIIFILYIYK